MAAWAAAFLLAFFSAAALSVAFIPSFATLLSAFFTTSAALSAAFLSAACSAAVLSAEALSDAFTIDRLSGENDRLLLWRQAASSI